MGHARDYAEDAAVLVVLVLAYKAWRGFEDATSPSTWWGGGKKSEPDAPDRTSSELTL